MTKAFSQDTVKLPRLPLTILTFSFLITLCSLLWLGMRELHSTQELQDIIESEFKMAELEASLHHAPTPSPPIKQENTLPSRMDLTFEKIHATEALAFNLTKLDENTAGSTTFNHHALYQKKHVHYFITVMLASLLSLLTGLVMLGLYSRRLKTARESQQRLEELLFYDQLSEVNTSTPTTLPLAFSQLQKNPDTFTAALQQALARQEFVLHYQPIINVESDNIIGMEALLYWQHPTFGLLSPGAFLPFCEKYGFILPLGAWVLQSACQQLKKWHRLGHHHLSMAINLSARQLNDATLLEMIKTALKENDLPPHTIKLEITESFIMQNVEANIQLLKSLRQLGLELSLDDFGTGYSSLNYLKQFPFSIIKIDRSFIADMTTNLTSMAIVESIVALSKSLGLTLVAEGIENKSQLHMLKKMNCDMVQGYLYSKPVVADAFLNLLPEVTHANAQMINQNAFQYTVLTNEHFDQAVNVIAHSFCATEPMTKYLGITQQEFIPFARLMVEKAIQDGLSIVALEDNKVSACTIVEDMANPLNINIEIDARFKIIFSLLEHLGSDFFHEKTLEPGHVAHLFITAVDKDYYKQGLSRKVNFESIQLAKQKNFDFMCCEFTHHYNEKGTVKNIKNSKLLIRSCEYKNYVFEGKKPFAHLEGYASAYIWELREEARLRYQIKEPDLA